MKERPLDYIVERRKPEQRHRDYAGYLCAIGWALLSILLFILIVSSVQAAYPVKTVIKCVDCADKVEVERC